MADRREREDADDEAEEGGEGGLAGVIHPFTQRKEAKRQSVAAGKYRGEH
jgi:hypothetical protein